MTPCKNGIVRLEDLPNDEIFVKLKSKFHKYIESKIRNFGIKKFEKKRRGKTFDLQKMFWGTNSPWNSCEKNVFCFT